MFNKGGSRSSSRDGKAMSCGLRAGVFISRPDEGDDKGLDSFEQLENVSFIFRDEAFSEMVLNSHYRPRLLDSVEAFYSSHFSEARRSHLKPLQA